MPVDAKQQVLFIQGAGKGAHVMDDQMVRSLRAALGAAYTVRYPMMPEEENALYPAWRAWLAQELAALAAGAIIVGHSAGCSVLLKYVTDAGDVPPLTGLFLLAAPYWGPGGWQDPGFSLDERQAARALLGSPVYFYHSRDDAVVPISHLAHHRAAFPQAVVRVFEQGGHQFASDLSELVADIAGLPRRPTGTETHP